MFQAVMWMYSNIFNIASAIAFAFGTIYTIYSTCENIFMLTTKFYSHDNRNLTLAIYDVLQKEMWFCNEYILWKNTERPAGLIVGKNFRFIAYANIDLYNNRQNIYLKIYTFRWCKSIAQDLVNNVDRIEMGDIAPLSSLSSVMQSNFETKDNLTKMRLLCKNGTQHEDEWDTIDVIAYRDIENVPFQSVDVTQYISNFMKHEQSYIGGVYLFSGVPGVGKTMACKLLSIELGGILCIDFNPSKPGHVIQTIISAAPPSATTPLIIVIEEVDRIFEKFGTITEHKKLVTQVTNKNDWNNMLEYIHSIENVVLIMTSNMTLQELSKKYDPALTRQYRITKRIAFTTKTFETFETSKHL